MGRWAGYVISIDGHCGAHAAAAATQRLSLCSIGGRDRQAWLLQWRFRERTVALVRTGLGRDERRLPESVEMTVLRCDSAMRWTWSRLSISSCSSNRRLVCGVAWHGRVQHWTVHMALPGSAAHIPGAVHRLPGAFIAFPFFGGQWGATDLDGVGHLTHNFRLCIHI